MLVNDKFSTKYLVLEVLRKSEKAVSGEAIASQAGVSRVAVWKAVQSLQTAGYGIESIAGGYSLSKDIPDSLYPWEFGAEESVFKHFIQTESTMTEARHIIEDEKKNTLPFVVTADTQTNGQGQQNHSWLTVNGSLACTVLTKEHIASACAQRLVMAAQVALVNALSSLTPRQYYVRWPNDIWSDIGKVGGILAEFSVLGNMCRWINVGIGVNVTESPHLPSCDYCTSDGTDVTRREILREFIGEFQKTMPLVREDSSILTALWNALCYDCSRCVQFEHDEKQYIFGGVNAYGWGLFSMADDAALYAEIVPPGLKSFIKHK